MEKMYLEKGDYEALKKYCDNSLEKLHKQRKVSNTGCFYFDSIINYKAAVAETFDIKFETKLMIPRDLKVETEDICICLGNLLDNAIEAAMAVEQEKRYVHVESKFQEGRLLLSIKNSKPSGAGSYRQTSKKDKIKHGRGIRSVRKVAEKYGGELLLKDQGEHFEAVLLLNGIAKLE